MKAAQYIPQSPEERVEGTSVLLPLPGRDGFVFFIGKTKKSNQDAEALFFMVSDQIHAFADSFGKEANAQQRFEYFLGTLNETLSQGVRQGRWHIPIEQFDALIGVACDKQMYLSGTGDLCALFLHKKQERYQIFNLFRSIQTEQSLPTWEKTFAVVLDGDLEEGDIFVVSNLDLQQTLQTYDLHAILTTLPPKGATEKIRQYFSERTGLLLLILRTIDQYEPSHLLESRATLKTNVSINQFKEQEEITERLLADQVPRMTTLIQKLKTSSKRVFEQKIWPWLWSRIRRMLWNIFKSLTHLRTREGRTETKMHFNAMLRKLEKRGQTLLYKATRLPRSTRYISVGIILVVAVLSVSISFFSSARAIAQQQKAYDEKVEKIEELMERAQGALIYKDENQARGLFLSASAMIDQLPSQTEEQKTKMTELKTSIQKSTDEIRHLVAVPNPALLGDLATLSDGVFGQTFVKQGEELYVFASDGRVYQLDRTQKIFQPVSVSVEGTNVAKKASVEDDAIYALLTNDVLVQFMKVENQQKTISYVKPQGEIRDFTTYAHRLYLLVLVGNDGQIYRFTKTDEGFGGGTNWITSRIHTLSEARSIAIDGSVFILQKNGQIHQFENGNELEYQTGVVDPPLTNASKIWTDTKSEYLYVLEPDTKRVVIFEKKTGAFVVQYKSESFQNLTDLIVDEDAYSIYLLSGSKIYSIAPSHL